MCAGCEGGADRRGARHRHEQTLPTRQQVQVSDVVELETKVHPKVRNHGEGPY